MYQVSTNYIKVSEITFINQIMQQCLKAEVFGDEQDWQRDQREQIFFQIKFLLE